MQGMYLLAHRASSVLPLPLHAPRMRQQAPVPASPAYFEEEGGRPFVFSQRSDGLYLIPSTVAS